jgi:peptidoglycan-N-acetylglucosamine deacetylase
MTRLMLLGSCLVLVLSSSRGRAKIEVDPVPKAAPKAAPKEKMAITFDDLPVHGDLPPKTTHLAVGKSIIATLTAEKIPEVYGFVNASRIQEEKGSEEVLHLWRKAGFPLGNHTYSHKDLNDLSIEDFKKEIETNESLLASVNQPGNKNSNQAKADLFLRFPYLHEGETLKKREAIRTYLKGKKYQIAQVTDDFSDWAWNTPYARCKAKGDEKGVARLKQMYLEAADSQFERDGKVEQAAFGRPIARILLLHIGPFDAEMLPELIRQYRKKGVEFIGLKEAIQDSAYKEDPVLALKDGDLFENQILKAHGKTIKSLGLDEDDGVPLKELETLCTH